MGLGDPGTSLSPLPRVTLHRPIMGKWAAPRGAVGWLQLKPGMAQILGTCTKHSGKAWEKKRRSLKSAVIKWDVVFNDDGRSRASAMLTMHLQVPFRTRLLQRQHWCPAGRMVPLGKVALDSIALTQSKLLPSSTDDRVSRGFSPPLRSSLIYSMQTVPAGPRYELSTIN